MSITKWESEIKSLAKDLDFTEIRAAEIMTDSSDTDAFLILHKWALQSLRGQNIKADYELVRELRQCLEGILENVTEAHIQEAKYKSG